MKRREVFEFYEIKKENFDNDYDFDLEMTTEDYDTLYEVIIDELNSKHIKIDDYILGHNEFNEIASGIIDKVSNNELINVDDYISDVYEEKFLEDIAEHESYKYMVAVESHYW